MKLRPNDYQRVLHDLHTLLHEENRFLAENQIGIVRLFTQEGKMIILVQCGRDAGKTEIAIYVAWRFALTNPGVDVYIICPEKLQGKKIYWNSNRLPNYGPQKYVYAKLRSASELRLILQVPGYPSSSIIVDGCENYDSLRGIKPGLVIYDEKQHHTKYFDEEVMQPNFSRGNVALLGFCTPPKRYCDYVDFRANIIEKVKENNPRYAYVELPTWTNPLSDREWLAEKKDDLFKKGKKNVWFREYEGKLIFDTESSILPYWSRERHSVSRDFIKERIKHDIKRLEWYAVFDPGTATCFAGLFLAVNPYRSEVYVLDEIYETKRGEATALKVWAKANAIKKKWNPNQEDWRNIYDSAAAWFPGEVLSDYERRDEEIDFGFLPTNKNAVKPRPDEGRAGESVLNGLMEAKNCEESGDGQLFFVNEDCEFFCKEIESYVTDESGRYPTTYDHLMDCLFYWVINSGYALAHQVDWDAVKKEAEKGLHRYETFDSIVEKELQKRDWGRGLDALDDMYDYEELEWH